MHLNGIQLFEKDSCDGPVRAVLSGAPSGALQGQLSADYCNCCYLTASELEQEQQQGSLR